ncbi:MAG: hypothetical protein K2K69_10780, partial [Muribaculaceae bacterium]|nr:hypothetical protein [Muribaculaceae bacterium]
VAAHTAHTPPTALFVEDGLQVAGAQVALGHATGQGAGELQTILNKESGVSGVSGVSSEMREIDAAIAAGNERAALALDMYILRLVKYLGAYIAEMGGVDIIVFTGGVGENQAHVREEVCKQFKFIGLEIDKAVNDATHGTEAKISTADSKVTVCVIPTDEELMIARDTEAIVDAL